MTSDQEAVCGTCGGKGEIRYRVGEFVYTCPDCNGTGRIPAPVVPSDERCGELFRRYDHCGLGKGHFGVHELSPPTPSQDAEGDGERAIERLVAGSAIPGPDWHDMLLMMQAHHNGEHDWSAKDPYDCTVCHVGIESFEERARAIGESAIREPYEELVEAARASHPPCEAQYRDGVRGCGTHMTRWPEGTPDCGYDPVNSALTRIEESHQ